MTTDFWNGIIREHAAGQATAARLAAQTYRGWEVHQGRWPEPNWLAVHPDYDASYEGPEDGWVGNGLATYASTYEALCDEIDTIIEEHPHFSREARP